MPRVQVLAVVGLGTGPHLPSLTDRDAGTAGLRLVGPGLMRLVTLLGSGAVVADQWQPVAHLSPTDQARCHHTLGPLTEQGRLMPGTGWETPRLLPGQARHQDAQAALVHLQM